MSIKAIKFNVDNLRPLIKAGEPVTVKDTEVKGLKFTIGKSKTAFTYDKRVSGRKGSALTFSMRAVVGAHSSVNYKEAREWAAELKRLCESGVDPREDREGRELLGLEPLPEDEPQVAGAGLALVMEDAIRVFFSKKTAVKPNTLKSFANNINRDFCQSWRKLDIRDITPAMIAAQFAERHRFGSKASAWEMLYTYSNIWNTNRKCFKDADGNKVLGESPIPETRQIIKEEYGIKRDKPKRMVVKNHQLGRFLAILDQLLEGSIPAPWLGEDGVTPPHVFKTLQLTQLSLFTGLRFSEARFLKWDYVDLDEGYFQLPGTIRDKGTEPAQAFKDYDENGKIQLNLDQYSFDFSGTKNGESHYVPMSTYVWELFRRLHAGRGDNPFVFASVVLGNRPVKRHENVFQFIQSLGFEYTPHAARRTFASVANDVGIGFRDLKSMLNHVSESDVTNGYIVPGFNPTKNRHNFQKVCDHILGKHAEFQGKRAKETEAYDKQAAFNELRRLVTKLGLTPMEAAKMLLAADGNHKSHVA